MYYAICIGILQCNHSTSDSKGLFCKGIHEKGPDEIRSAVCYTVYTIHLSLCTQTADIIVKSRLKNPVSYYVILHVSLFGAIGN